MHRMTRRQTSEFGKGKVVWEPFWKYSACVDDQSLKNLAMKPQHLETRLQTAIREEWAFNEIMNQELEISKQEQQRIVEQTLEE